MWCWTTKLQIQVLTTCVLCLVLGCLQVAQGKNPEAPCTPWDEASNALEKPAISCARPVELLYEGQSFSGVSAKRSSQLPSWFNATSFEAGQKFATKYFYSQFYGPILALSMFTSFPDIVPVLMSTNKSDTASRSNRRYLATMLHMKLWFEILAEPEAEQTEPGVNSLILESLLNVRGIHHQIINQLKRKVPTEAAKGSPDRQEPDTEFWEAVRQDLEASTIPKEFREYPEAVKLRKAGVKPMSHLSMSLTQWMLGGPQVLFPEACGIHGASDEEFEAFNHFWAVLGYAMGMEDEYNVALQPGGLGGTREYYRELYETYFVPSMFQFGHDGKILWEAFFTGFIEAIFGSGRIGQFMRKEQFIILILEEFMGVRATNVRARLSITESALNAGLKQLIWMSQFDSVRDGLNEMAKKFYFQSNSQDVFGFDGSDPVDIVTSAYG